MEIKNKKIDRKFLGGWILNRVRPVWRWKEDVFVWRWGGSRWWVHIQPENYFCLEREGRDVVKVAGGICWRLQISNSELEKLGFDGFRERFENEVVQFLEKTFREYERVNESSKILVGELGRELEDLRARVEVALFGYRLGSRSECFCRFPDFIGNPLGGWSCKFVCGDGFYFRFCDLEGSKILCEILARFVLDLSAICRDVVGSGKRWGIRWRLGGEEYALVCDEYGASIVEFVECEYVMTLLSVDHGHVSSLGGLLSDRAFVDSSLLPVREYCERLKRVLNSLIEFLEGGGL
jgi:hypothetical protein